MTEVSRSTDSSSAHGTGPEGEGFPDETAPGTDSMDALLAAVAAAPPVSIGQAQVQKIEPGTVIADTYRVERRIGGGGMGVVYLAEHMELLRPVALKLHLGAVDSPHLVRLRREARVMAKLAHPNVLAVHGVGLHEGRMFIAMEFAEGGTLKDWTDAGPRGWQEVVDMCIEAGRGLAAAHHVGVVHRDFKPDNVLVGSDGRPKVADFGLARRWDDSPEPSPGIDPAMGLAEIQRFTVTGAVVGTPAYMSPEQFDGMEVGPASDQFAFCVVLYEMLTGQRPFAGHSVIELAQAVCAGRTRPIPSGVRIPGRLRALLARGLEPIPGARHPSMEVLVDALERVRGARRRRLRWSIGTAALGGAMLVGTGVAVMAAPQPCERVELELGEAWSDERREAVVSAWEPSLHEDRAEAIAAIDDWATRWGETRREVCEATRVREEASELEFDLRMACLGRLASRLDGLTTELRTGSSEGRLDRSLIEGALPPLSRCNDMDALERLENRHSEQSYRDTPARDRAWTEAEGLLSQALMRLNLGRPGAVELAERAEALAQEHALPFMRPQALNIRADVLDAAGPNEEGAELRGRAMRIAVAEGSDAVVVDLALGQAESALGLGELDAAAIHLDYSEVFLPRILDPVRKAEFDGRFGVVQGRLFYRRGEYAQAVESLTPIAMDPDAELMTRRSALMRLGRVHKKLEEPQRAIEVWQQLVEYLAEVRGEDHPDLAMVLENIAGVRIAQGDVSRALEDLTRAESIVTKAFGKDAPQLAKVVGKRGLALSRLGRYDDARAAQERALELRIALYGEKDSRIAFPMDELGTIARLQGDHERALEHLERARSIRLAAYGPDHRVLAQSLLRIARVHLDRGDVDTAIPLLHRARGLVGDQDPSRAVEIEQELRRANVVVEPRPDVTTNTGSLHP